MKIPTHVKLPEGTPKWLEWLVGVTEEATKARMAITMFVVLGTSLFMTVWTAHNDAAALESIKKGCPCEAAGGVCRLPLVNESRITTAEGQTPYLTFNVSPFSK